MLVIMIFFFFDVIFFDVFGMLFDVCVVLVVVE